MIDPKILTIDGPSGVGKGTLAKNLADELGWTVLDRCCLLYTSPSPRDSV